MLDPSEVAAYQTKVARGTLQTLPATQTWAASRVAAGGQDRATKALAVDTTGASAATLGAGLGGMAGVVGFPKEEVRPIAPAIAAATPALASLGVPASVLTLLGLAGGAYGLYQALGGGQGLGIGGINLLGGQEGYIPGTMIPLGGPFLPEPPAEMVVKEWSTGTAQFYQLIDGRIAVYAKSKKSWKVYRPYKPCVIGKNMPSHRMMTRLHRYLARHKADATTILKITSPVAYARHLGYRKYGRRR